MQNYHSPNSTHDHQPRRLYRHSLQYAAGSPNGLLACDSMCASPLKLPMQDLARTIKYRSVAISHVHRTSQFKLSRSRQYMLLHLGDA